MPSVFDFSAKLNNGEEKSLADYRGKVLLIVNTASKCGFTPQYKGLEELYQKYRKQGLEILGFPCDQFGHQEPGSDKEIRSFCELNYGVTFPLFSKIEVNGKNEHPLYKHLKERGGRDVWRRHQVEFHQVSGQPRGQGARPLCSVTSPRKARQ